MPLIVNYWPQAFKDRLGGSWPLHYCAIDVETTGLDTEVDLPYEIGHCLVRDGKEIDRSSVLIDWTKDPAVSTAWLQARLDATGGQLGIQGLGQRVTARLLTHGLAPAAAIGFYRDFLGELREREILICAHNGYRFDELILRSAFQRAGMELPDFGEDGLLDTALVELANELLPKRPQIPVPGDTLRTYFTRVGRQRGRVKFNLSEHCRNKYQIPLEPKQFHKAANDAFAVHWLMECWRRQQQEYRPVTQQQTRRRRGQRNR